MCCVVTLGGVVLRWVSGSSTCTKRKRKGKKRTKEKNKKKEKCGRKIKGRGHRACVRE